MDIEKSEPGIPRSILRILRGWPGRRPDRSAPPQRMVWRRHDTAPRQGLRWQDVRELAREQLIRDDWRGEGDSIAVTGAELDAFLDFCDEAYAAWMRLQARLAAGDVIAA